MDYITTAITETLDPVRSRTSFSLEISHLRERYKEPWVLNRSTVRSERAADVNRSLRERLAGRVLLQDFQAHRLRAFYPRRSDRPDTRSPVSKRLPLFQSGPLTDISTQGSASLHPGLRSSTPSACSPGVPS